MRNGGRHCCQPPLRRDLGLPVFARERPRGPAPFTILALQLRRRARFDHRSLVGSSFPGSASLLPCGNRPASSGSAVARLSASVRSPSWRPATLAGEPASLRLSTCPAAPARTLRPLPLPVRTLGPGLAPCVARPASSFRGPSWADRSCRRTGLGPKTRPAGRNEDDRLFRRLLPTSLSGDPPRECRHPGRPSLCP